MNEHDIEILNSKIEQVEYLQKSIYEVLSQYDEIIMKNRVVFFIIGATLTNVVWMILK